ncbi:FAD-dependent oxidoreductase [Candidatus Pacearchaeota archaeon]|nr:FAD-dependent oxidoreductase [Candidatus Pacearchaeota archaeon]
MKKYDLIIIGAGPAGLTAALYAARYKINVLVIGKIPGGLVAETSDICNFPSYPEIKGFELAKKMLDQVKELNVEVTNEEVSDIKKKKVGFEIITNKNKYDSKKIIFATGSERKKLGIKREQELIGKGISYCATCDAAFYKDKVAGVVGGSDAALTAALLLVKFAKKVYIIYRKDKFFRGDKIWIDNVQKSKNIEPLFNSKITKLIGKEKLEAIEINNKKEIKVNGIFVEVGGLPNIDLAEDLGVIIDKKEIKVCDKQKTNVKGFFAAGDVTNNPLKQIITACGQGAIATNTAYRELMKEK